MRAWFERLLEISEFYKNSQGVEKESWFHHLLGYIDSAKFIEKD